jgi:hypothetical protein
VFDKELAMLFTVHQIQIDRSVYDRVNELGHEQAAEQYPEYRAYMDCSFRGSKKYKPEYSQYFKPVCTIEADNLNRVFDIGNIGPESAITRLLPMHSISVGDIIVDPNGVKHMVNSFGFEEIA